MFHRQLQRALFSYNLTRISVHPSYFIAFFYTQFVPPSNQETIKTPVRYYMHCSSMADQVKQKIPVVHTTHTQSFFAHSEMSVYILQKFAICLDTILLEKT